MVVYFSIAADGFASPQRAVFILQSVAITGILALGVTATLVVGGFDLSIGSVATTAMMASAYVMVVMGGDAITATVVCLADRRCGRTDQRRPHRLHARAGPSAQRSA